MSHSIEIIWELGDQELSPGKYLTDHKVILNDNLTIDAGSSPDYGGSVSNINPEQKLAAAVSSCFMMTFLALAAKMKWPVKNYKDKAISYLGKNNEGRMYVNKIELNPQIIFDNDFTLSDDEMHKMKERSHKYCFIANSLSKDVEIKIN
jgi:organic hydroperoxide reductase OsmC/OhrA